MGWSSVSKVLQKQAHDFLSQRNGSLILTVGTILIIVSAFQFGEVVMEWSTEKYAAVFNSFSDNIAGKSYRTRLCLPVPIDVVYTWVNGSDPKLVAELRRQKMLLERELNETSSTIQVSDTCAFSHCIPATGVILEPRIPAEISLANMGILYPAFQDATQVLPLENPAHGNTNVSLVMFDTQEQVDKILNTTVFIQGKNVSILQAYYTSDWTLPNAVVLHDTVLMTGFPHTLEKQELYDKIPAKFQKSISKFELHSGTGVAVIVMATTDEADSLIREKNITIDGKEPSLTSANLIWDLKDYSMSEDVSANRFEDNEELRYSLRSIEQFAPWVRHVYIVTNGQIPSWLNLDSPRLTVVPHRDIFLNASHLPTFSSPAIESHLHRIPGLSDKFIYLNDDVMFGKPVWPDDFYTHSRGQKIYLTWPVPNCQEGCPSSWIRDGYCDKACNNSECEWDGGDCKGDGGSQAIGGAAFGGIGEANLPSPDLYCNTGCANSWIADRYCDNACNVYPCGFDAGDCGTQSYHRLKGALLTKDSTEITVPQGERVFYLNLTSLIGENGTIEEANYNDSKIVRTVAVGLKFKVVTMVLYGNKSAETIEMKLKGKDNAGVNFQLNFSVCADTKLALEPKVEETPSKQNETKPKEVYKFEDVPEQIRVPKALPLELDPNVVTVDVNMSLFELSDDIQKTWDELLRAKQDGEITDKGFSHERGALWNQFISKLKAEGKQPVLRNLTRHHDNETKPAVEHERALNASTENKDPNSMKEFFHNVSSKLKSAKLNGEEKDKIAEPLQDKSEHRQPIDDKPQEPHKDKLILEQSLNNSDEALKFRTRKLNSVEQIKPDENAGFLPWERDGTLKNLQKLQAARINSDSYQVSPVRGRRLLDTFGDSLRHVNKLYNSAFGYTARKVPAHMPHMVDKNIMGELQARFPAEWDVTSSHKIRSSDDMQFAFSYFYYVMGEPAVLTVRDVFEEMDIDKSGVLSDREVRTMATRLHDPPLDLQTLTSLEDKLKNCSRHAPLNPWDKLYRREKYYDSEMPQVTLHLLENCLPVIHLMEKAYKTRTKYSHEVMGDDEVAFKMIRTNVSQVVGQLDDIRRHPKKFICLNDNIDHSKEEAKTVKAVLVDFYEAMYPTASSFELGRDYRNRFLHLDELAEWRKYRDWLKLWTQIALVFLILFTIASFFSDKIEALQKKFLGRRRIIPSSGNSPSSGKTPSTAPTDAATGVGPRVTIHHV